LYQTGIPPRLPPRGFRFAKAKAAVSPGDPATYLGAVTVLVASGVLGCAVPARRAIRIDPIVALRYE